MTRSRKLWLPVLTLAGLALAMAPRTEAHKRVMADGRVIPHWVRYPFEFQLCGVRLGSRAVDRDPQNKIDRYSLFFVHGNPTALVAPGVGTLTQGQAPPGSGVPVLEQTPNAPWLQAVSIGIPAGHVMWLYRRDDFAMGYVVDPLGFVTAITVAGDSCPIAGTQQIDPYHTVRLGDDFRKVLFRYGYPDIISLFGIVGDNSGDLAGGSGSDGSGGEGSGGGFGGAGGGGGRAGGARESLGPPQRFYARNRDVQSLAMELGALTRLQTRSSARLNPKSKSGSRVVPPLPPATLEVRSSGFLGAMPPQALSGGGGASAPAGGGFRGGAGGLGGGAGGLGGDAGGALGGEGGGAGGAGGGGAFNNGTATTYQIDYRETYNVMFTIRNNRVVRIFIWGDPDYFTDRQCEAMRRQF